MIFVDPIYFDRQHYKFTYVRRQFLGAVRTYVFDVTPLPKSGDGRFLGRIWVEDQNFAIVRFNGVFVPVARAFGWNLHFDSWRTNVVPNQWIPSYFYSAVSIGSAPHSCASCRSANSSRTLAPPARI